MNIVINKETFIDFIIMTLKIKGVKETDICLYEQMYNRRIDNGFFDNNISDINDIIYSDYYFCNVLCSADEGYAEIEKIYHKQGLGSINCEEYPIGYCFAAIEAYKDGRFLVRW